MGRLIDVSMMIYTGMMVWPGDDGVDLHRVQRLEDGAHSNLSRLVCGVHTGTHVDAPFHFIPGGKTIEQLPLEVLIGPAWVAAFPEVRRIGAEELEIRRYSEGNHSAAAQDGQFQNDRKRNRLS